MIFGAGPIGLLTALVARHRGAGDVVLVEPNAWRRGVAESYGFPVLPSDDTTPERIRERTAGRGGPRLRLGRAPERRRRADRRRADPGHDRHRRRLQVAPAVDLRALNFAEHRLIGTRVYAPDDFATAIDLIERDALALSRLPPAPSPRLGGRRLPRPPRARAA
ncbi:hypothetical protein NKH77_10990 [Streptomyces sp. M19]